jgi:hypothetical protein
LNLLKFVKESQSMRSQPVIILYNKFDDPDDDEQGELVAEARKEVETIFDVGNRLDALVQMMEQPPSGMGSTDSLFPVFLPFSASHAYFHQTASLLSSEEFKQFEDVGLIEKYGKEYLGRIKWSGMPMEEKFKSLHEIVTDPATRKQGLGISGFDRLLGVLNACIGGPAKQKDLIVDRLNATLECVTVGPRTMSEPLAELLAAYQFLADYQKDDSILSNAVDAMSGVFWRQFLESHEKAISSVKLSPHDIKLLAPLMTELLLYRDVVQSFPLIEKLREQEAIDLRMHRVGKSFLDVVIGQGSVSLPKLKKSGTGFPPATGGFSLGGSTTAPSPEPSFPAPAPSLFAAPGPAPAPSIWAAAGATGQGTQTSTTALASASDASAPTTNLWEELAPSDWVKIYNSLLLVASNSCFCVLFGTEKISIEELLYETRKLSDPERIVSSSMKVKSREAIEIPRSIYEPNHFGYLLWRLCDFISSLNTSSKDPKWLENFTESAFEMLDLAPPTESLSEVTDVPAKCAASIIPNTRPKASRKVRLPSTIKRPVTHIVVGPDGRPRQEVLYV